MPKTVNPDPDWTDTLEVPLPHETMDSGDVAVPDTRLLANDKWLKKEFGARLDALERAMWPTTIQAELTASETDSSAHIWRFEYSLSTNRGTIASATLDFGDGRPVVTLSNPGTPGFVTHDYPDVDASYTAVLNVETSEGASQRVEQVVVIGNAISPAEPQPYVSVNVYSESIDFPEDSPIPHTTGQTGGRARSIYPNVSGVNGDASWVDEGSQPLPRAIKARFYDITTTEGYHNFRDTNAFLLDISGTGGAESAVEVQATFGTAPSGSTLYLEYGGNGAAIDQYGEFAWTDSVVLEMPITANVALSLDPVLLARGQSRLIFTVSNQGEADTLPVLDSVNIVLG